MKHLAFLHICALLLLQGFALAQPPAITPSAEMARTDAANMTTAANQTAWRQALDVVGVVKNGSFTAENQSAYVMVATGTVTDPGTPAEGEGFVVLVRNGTATVGGTAYATAGTIIRRIYHSGAWANYATATYDPANVAITGGTITGITDLAIADGGTGASNTVSARANLYSVNPQIQQLSGMAHLYDAIQALDVPTDGSTYVGITNFGDSMVSEAYWFGFFMAEGYKRYGCGAFGSPGFTQTWNGAAWTLTGSASEVSNDWSYTPTGYYVNITAGDDAEIELSGPYQQLRNSGSRTEAKIPEYTDDVFLNGGCRQVSVFCIQESGAGTLDVTISQDQETDITESFSLAGSDALIRKDYTPGNKVGALTVNLAASTASVKVLGVVFWGDHGLVYVDSGAGGTTMTQQAACLSSGSFQQPYIDLLEDFGVSTVFHMQRAAGDASYQTNYATFFDAYAELDLGQLVFSELPRLPGNESSPTTAETNKFLQEYCHDNDLAFFDSRQVISSDVETALGWNSGDDTHKSYDHNRYFAGRIWQAIGGLRSAYDFQGFGGDQQRGRDRYLLDALKRRSTHEITGMGGITAETASTSGTGFSHFVNNERGFRFLHGTALGHSATRIGAVVAGSVLMETDEYDLVCWANGYRNLDIEDGAMGFILFGGGSTNITTLTGLTDASFGLQFSTANDQSVIAGYTDEVVRIFENNGTTTTYSPWVRTSAPGEGAGSQYGYGFVLKYDMDQGMLYLYASSNRSAWENYGRLIMTLDASALKANSQTAGSWVHTGVYAEDGANIPAASGELSWKNVGVTWGRMPPPFSTQD